jgi:Uma2 family endonuclease
VINAMAILANARPPLVAGDRLTRSVFFERYRQMPRGVKARLIDGVVYLEGGDGVAGPVGSKHGRTTGRVGTWLGFYAVQTPGVREGDNMTIDLGESRMPQPDNLLWVLEEFGGRVHDDGQILHGPPELVIEVADTSRSIDLGPQLKDYERAEVREYVVFALDPNEIYWHVWRDGRLEPVAPDPDGIYRSPVFPGLWLDSAAFWAENGPALIATLQRGLACPEHAHFIARLQAAHHR